VQNGENLGIGWLPRVPKRRNNVTRTGKFVTPEELDIVKTAQSVSGMFLSGGMPMGDPAHEVEILSNGEFVSP
jgi:hypothetical protein